MIQVPNPSKFKASFRWFVNAINDNFAELQASIQQSASGYDGDPATINQDSSHRFVSDTEKGTWNGKAEGTHSHAIGDVTNLQSTLNLKASTSHNHDASYAAINHNHSGTYEPANANIQTHISQPHAPSNAQANVDITKAEIEAKLTGTIASHNHESVFTLASDVATAADVNPVSLTGLVFTYAANSIYRIWFMGRVSPAAATTGCGFQFDLSSAVTSIDVQFFHQLASTGTLSGGHSIADDASVGVSSGLPGTGNYPVTGFGLLRTSGNTGTAQLRFRSETTAVITARAGLTLVVEKIA
mgnify:CR=1 FL=1